MAYALVEPKRALLGAWKRVENTKNMKAKPAEQRDPVRPEKPSPGGALITAAPPNQAPVWPAKIERILVPVDFSDFSATILKYAVSFAAGFGAHLRLLHVVAPVPYTEELMVIPDEIEDLNEALEKDGIDGMNSLVSKYVPAGVATSVVVRTGRPFSEIVAEAQAWPADMVIIPTHGRTGLMHVLIGSTTERVVRLCTCPVLVVRVPEAKP